MAKVVCKTLISVILGDLFRVNPNPTPLWFMLYRHHTKFAGVAGGFLHQTNCVYPEVYADYIVPDSVAILAQAICDTSRKTIFFYPTSA